MSYILRIINFFFLFFLYTFCCKLCTDRILHTRSSLAVIDNSFSCHVVLSSALGKSSW